MGRGIEMKDHPYFTQIMNHNQVKEISKKIEKRRELPIYRLQLPNVDDLRKETIHYANSLFPMNKKNKQQLVGPIG